MKSRYRSFLAAVLLITPFVLIANGSPFDVSPIQQVGDIRLVRMEDISLDEEVISIGLYGDFVNVRVKYTFTNHGAADTVAYAFPVDYYDEHGEIDWQYPDGWEDACIPYFRIADETGELPVAMKVKQDSILVEQGTYQSSGREYSIYWGRRWFTTRIYFPPNQTKELIVSYRIKAAYTDWITTKSFVPSYNPRGFTYDLNPSTHWGDGTVDNLKVVVDARLELGRGGEIDTLLLPGDYVENDGVFTFEASDFQLGNADDIVVAYTIDDYKYNQFYEESRVPAEHITAVRASSELEGYPVENLLDGDPATAWVEGVDGAGFGQVIEIEFSDFLLSGVAVLNGYTKNADTYYMNNRLHMVRFEMFDAEGNRMKYYDMRRGFDAKPYSEFDPDVPWTFINFLGRWSSVIRPDFTEGMVRITIVETYPGTTYDDTAISELLLFGFPSEF